MHDNLLSTWEFSADRDSSSVILPDGCRDIIFTTTEQAKHDCFVTSLFDRATQVSIQAGAVMTGFRLKPGVRVKHGYFMNSVSSRHVDKDEIYNRIDDFTFLNPSLEEALEYLASAVKSVAQVAKEIGVSQRTLQRLLMLETNRSPTYWLMLARARKAARSLTGSIPLIEIADSFGYSDQAHMSREFKRWFNISPSKLRDSPVFIDQLNHSGYD